jgi:hypothetical protein
MPYRLVYEPDEADSRMYEQGWVSADLAIDLYKQTPRSLGGLVKSGEVVHQRIAGRDFYDLESLEDLHAGRYPSVRRQAEQEAHWAVVGYPEAPAQQSPAEPGIDFLKKFGRTS